MTCIRLTKVDLLTTASCGFKKNGHKIGDLVYRQKLPDYSSARQQP